MKYFFRNAALTFIILYSLGVNQLFGSDTLEQIQKAIQRNNANWIASETKISKMSLVEQKKLLGALPEPQAKAANMYIMLPKLKSIPASFDWRNNEGNWVTPVRNQSSCGSCWDFSAIGQVEAWWKIHHSNLDSAIDLSEQFILSCTDGDCDGWRVSSALDFIKDTGVPGEQCFPYQADDTIPCDSACSDWESQAVKIPGWGFITLDEAIVDNIKQAVFRHPVSASYEVYQDFNYYSGGVYEYVWGDLLAGHAILIVGWNDSEKSWICKNSWGPDWGETIDFKPYTPGAGDGGYFRIKWDNCKIGRNMPFIWDSATGASALSVYPEQIDLEFEEADSSISRLITISNLGTGILEYAASDYELPIAFHPDNYTTYDDESVWWCADTSISGYNDHWLQYLDTPLLDLSSTILPKLTYMGYWTIEDPAGAPAPWDGWDGYNVWISVDGGRNFTVAIPTAPEYNCANLWSFGEPDQGWDFGLGIPGWGGSVDDWVPVEFDLSGYQSDSVIVRFAFASDLGWCSIDDPALLGLFLDKIQISDGDNVLFFDTADEFSAMISSGYGNQKADWLEITEGVGVVPANSSKDIELNINIQNLAIGIHKGMVAITSNDSTSTGFEIPVNLNILKTVNINNFTQPVLKEWTLFQNYPNPFNPITKITYRLPRSADINLSVYTVTGQLVRVIKDGFQNQGLQSVIWDGKNNRGKFVSTGKYIYVLKTGKNEILAKQMIMIK